MGPRQRTREEHGHSVAVAQDGWEELELWRLFKSSNAKVVSHENLLVTRQAEPEGGHPSKVCFPTRYTESTASFTRKIP